MYLFLIIDFKTKYCLFRFLTIWRLALSLINSFNITNQVNSYTRHKKTQHQVQK
jgi:hypothetical protein